MFLRIGFGSNPGPVRWQARRPSRGSDRAVGLAQQGRRL